MSIAVVKSASDQRLKARSNVFLAATLTSAGTSRPVRLRNISTKGALLDGPNLPAAGSIVFLRRGSLSAEGELAWQEADQCGLRFMTDVCVEDWIRRIGHPGQQRVDKIVRLLNGPPFPDAVSLVVTQTDDSLVSISADLSETCELLASFPEMIATHPDELAKLDAVAQRLRQIALP